LEREYVDLVRLEDDFFDSLRVFINEKKEKIKQQRDLFDNRLSQELFNIKNMLEQIISLRQKKIINKAIIYVQTGEEDIDNMLLVEQRFYKKLVKLLEQYNDLVSGLFTDSKKQGLEVKTVEILQDVPKFMGTDMKEYGPYKVGDVVDLPLSIAKIFFDKGIAKEKEE